MNPLLDAVLRAHGGIGRWYTFEKVSATFVTGGGLLPMKGFAAPPLPLFGTATIHLESTVIASYGRSDRRMIFTPERVAIENLNGAVVEERVNPRASFAGHTLNTPWDSLQRAYFRGYSSWTYLNTPFLLALPGVQVNEIEPWREGVETWRGLHATFPPTIASHSCDQEFYFGRDHLLRRHDYSLEIAGCVAVAQYVFDLVEAQGFIFPSRRRAYVRGPQLAAIRDLLLIASDISDFSVTK